MHHIFDEDSAILRNRRGIPGLLIPDAPPAHSVLPAGEAISSAPERIDLQPAPDESRASRRAKLWAAGFFLVFTCVFFWQPVFAGRTFYIFDHALIYLPLQVENARLRAAGEVPLWNRWSGIGYPSQAEAELSGIYPPGLIFNVIGTPHTAYVVFVLFHFLVAALSTMFLARTVGASIFGQILAALTFTFSATFVAATYSLTQATTFAWAPLILGLQLEALRSRTWRPAILGGLVFAVQMSGPHPQSVFSMVLLMFAAVLSEARGAERWRRLWFAFRSTAVIGGVGAVLAAPQILYTLELLSTTTKWEGVSYEELVHCSFPPLQFLQLLIPNLNGTNLTLWDFLPESEAKCYVSLMGLLLLGLGWRSPGRFQTFLRVSLVMCVVLALGRYSGVYRVLHVLPGFRQIHYPFRFLIPASLIAALLIGLGVERLIRSEWSLRAAARPAIAFAVLALVLAALSITSLCSLADRFLAGEYLAVVNLGRDLTSPGFEAFTRFENFATSALISSLTAAACAGFCLWLGLRPPHHAVGIALIVLVSADLLIANGDINRFGPSNRYSDVPPNVEFLKSKREHARVWQFHRGSEFLEPLPGEFAFNSAAFLGIESLNSFMAATRLDIRSQVGDDSSRERSAWTPRHLGMLSVKYVQSRVDLPGDWPSWECYHDESYRIYENPEWLPRARFHANFRIVSSPEEATQLLGNQDFDLSRFVILESTPDTFLPGDELPQPAAASSVRIVDYRSQRVQMSAELNEPGVVLLNDLHYPGWRATSNGRPVEILRANRLMRGLALGPGRHMIEFVYRPRSFFTGCWISVTGATFLLVGAGAARIRRRTACGGPNAEIRV